MLKKLLFMLFFIISNNNLFSSTKKDSEEQKNKHLEYENQNLSLHGLTSEINKLVKKENNYFYYQFDQSNDGHSDRIFELLFSPDSKYLASSSYDNSVKIWDMDSKSKTFAQCIYNFNRAPCSLTFSPCGKYLALGDYNIYILDLDRNNRTFKQCIHTIYNGFGIETLLFSPCGRYLISGNYDGFIKIWSINNNEFTHIHSAHRIHGGHRDTVYALVFSPCGKYLVSGGGDHNIKIWNMDIRSNEFMKCIHTIDSNNDGHLGWVNALVFSPCGKYLISSSLDQTIKIWDIGSISKAFVRCIATIDNGHKALSFSPCGKYFVSACSIENIIKIWKIDTTSKDLVRCIHSIDKGYHRFGLSPFCLGQYISFSPCGKYLAFGAHENIKILLKPQDIFESIDLHEVQDESNNSNSRCCKSTANFLKNQCCIL